MKYLYGPVDSRRLGLSLGISLTPYKTCNFDCVYCQLGRTAQRVNKRKEYIKISEILGELKDWATTNQSILKRTKYITLSGLGEPTLNIKIKELIKGIKKITRVPIAVITNSSYLSDPAVRSGLSGASLIVPSLDAVDQAVFEKVDRPDKLTKIKDIISGLISLRKEFRGKIWLEVMLVKGLNDNLKEIAKLREVITKINPDRIQLNSPVRRTAEAWVSAVDKKTLESFKKILGAKCEIL